MIAIKECNKKAYAKINLSLDVIGKKANGYHEVRMIMQAINLFDSVTVRLAEPSESDSARIRLTSDSKEIPCDETNLAWKAAALLLTKKREKRPQDLQREPAIHIHIEKKIPIAAGLAGGSADGAAVLHALNELFELELSLQELMELGVKLGADVPFCLMAQAASTFRKPAGGASQQGATTQDAICASQAGGASTCAEATGIGECLSPLPPLPSFVLLSKPPIAVSTAEVYGALDLSKIDQRPSTDEIIEALHRGDENRLYKNMYNVLEKVSCFLYPEITDTKNAMDLAGFAAKAMMSGSGPTVFMLAPEQSMLEPLLHKMKTLNRETFLVETLVIDQK